MQWDEDCADDIPGAWPRSSERKRKRACSSIGDPPFKGSEHDEAAPYFGVREVNILGTPSLKVKTKIEQLAYRSRPAHACEALSTPSPVLAVYDFMRGTVSKMSSWYTSNLGSSPTKVRRKTSTRKLDPKTQSEGGADGTVNSLSIDALSITPRQTRRTIHITPPPSPRGTPQGPPTLGAVSASTASFTNGANHLDDQNLSQAGEATTDDAHGRRNGSPMKPGDRAHRDLERALQHLHVSVKKEDVDYDRNLKSPRQVRQEVKERLYAETRKLLEAQDDLEIDISKEGAARFAELQKNVLERKTQYEREQALEAERLEAERLAAEEAARLASKGVRRVQPGFIKQLDQALDAMVVAVRSCNPNEQLTTAKDGTVLRKKDLMTLLGETSWLNDEVINAQLDWIVDRANSTVKGSGVPKAVTFNSFFYDKLSKEGHKGVARWSKRKGIAGKKLLEAETILVPVNHASHWTLIVISGQQRTIEYLDSFGGTPDTFLNNGMKWVAGELGSAYDPAEWTMLETRCAAQRNGYDCGLFLLTNAECAAAGIDTAASYNGSHMSLQRRRIAAILLQRGFGDLGISA